MENQKTAWEIAQEESAVENFNCFDKIGSLAELKILTGVSFEEETRSSVDAIDNVELTEQTNQEETAVEALECKSIAKASEAFNRFGSACKALELEADAEFHGLPEHEVIAFAEPEVQLFTPSITVEDALQALIDDRNSNVIQINDLIQIAEDNDIVIANMQKEVATVAALREQVSELTDQLILQENMIDALSTSYAEKSRQITKDAERMNEVSKIEVRNLNLQAFYTESKDELTRLQKVEAKADKAADKAAKDIKALKANKADMFNSNKELRKRIANLQSDNAQYRGCKERQKEWVEVYNNSDDEHLILHPMRQDLGSSVQKGGNAVLLYTQMTGAYITAAYDVNHGVVFSSFLNIDNQLSDRTKSTILNNSLRPSAKVIEFAKKWLYKVNIKQNATPVSADVVVFSEKLNKEKDSD